MSRSQLPQNSVDSENGFSDHRISFRNGDGIEASPLECVVPIGLYDPQADLFQPIATGVFVSYLGLVATARHAFVFEPQFQSQLRHLSNESYLAIYQYFPDHSYTIRPILCAHSHPIYDLAIAVCVQLTAQSTGLRFENLMQGCTTEIMGIGTPVHQYSYPDPLVYPTDDGLQVVMVPCCTEGKIIDWLPNGMGRLFPSPVYVIEGYIGAGSSGGPVMDETGRVIAINSRGCEAANYYYAIPVSGIADIRVESVQLASEPLIHGPTVREMAARGFMSFVKRA